MRFGRLPSLVLAAVLPFAPLARIAPHLVAVARAPLAQLLRWVAGTAALLGSFHSVSGASASISGLSLYLEGKPVGLPTNSAVASVGQEFDWRITVRNPDNEHALDFFDCQPLPPGLTIDRELGASGHITGVPTTVGVYPVVLIAGNAGYLESPLEFIATITILEKPEAPVITESPRNRRVLAGDTVIFTVTATGTEPLSFQWLFNGTPLPGAVAASLEIANVKTTDAGNYEVVVSNLGGSVKGTLARLSVQEPLIVLLQLGLPQRGSDRVTVPITGPIRTNYVVWVSDDLRSWRPVATNAVVDGLWQFSETGGVSLPARFYRAQITP